LDTTGSGVLYTVPGTPFDARVLFTSGYTADFMRSRGELETGVDLIVKPVKTFELLRKVREMLDR